MSRLSTYPINSEKLRTLIKAKGHITELSFGMGYKANALNNAIRRGKITMPMALALENMYGIPYDEYKYEEPTPEEPTPDPETKIVTKDDMFMKSVVAMLAEICNNQRVMNDKLDNNLRAMNDKLDRLVGIWEEF